MLTVKNTFNSIKDANTKNAQYMTKQVNPIFQSSLNLLSASDTYKAISVDNNDMAEYVIPDELIVI